MILSFHLVFGLVNKQPGKCPEYFAAMYQAYATSRNRFKIYFNTSNTLTAMVWFGLFDA